MHSHIRQTKQQGCGLKAKVRVSKKSHLKCFVTCHFKSLSPNYPEPASMSLKEEYQQMCLKAVGRVKYSTQCEKHFANYKCNF